MGHIKYVHICTRRVLARGPGGQHGDIETGVGTPKGWPGLALLSLAV